MTMTVVDEVQLAQVLATAVAPDIEPMRALARWVVARRNHDPVGLDGAVNLRDVRMHSPGACLVLMTGVEPLTFRQGVCGIHCTSQQLVGDRDFARVEEFVVFERIAHRLGVDFHVRQFGKQRRFFAQLIAQPGKHSSSSARPALSRAASSGGTEMPGGGTGRTFSATLSAGPSAIAVEIAAIATVATRQVHFIEPHH